MGKHSRCVIGIWDNDMRYPELHKKRIVMWMEMSSRTNHQAA